MFEDNHHNLSLILTLLMPVFYLIGKTGDFYFKVTEGKFQANRENFKKNLKWQGINK